MEWLRSKLESGESLEPLPPRLRLWTGSFSGMLCYHHHRGNRTDGADWCHRFDRRSWCNGGHRCNGTDRCTRINRRNGSNGIDWRPRADRRTGFDWRNGCNRSYWCHRFDRGYRRNGTHWTDGTDWWSNRSNCPVNICTTRKMP